MSVCHRHYQFMTKLTSIRLYWNTISIIIPNQKWVSIIVKNIHLFIYFGCFYSWLLRLSSDLNLEKCMFFPQYRNYQEVSEFIDGIRQSYPGVNFINILLLSMHFLHKHCFGSFFLRTCNYRKAAETTFVKKLYIKCWWNWLQNSQGDKLYKNFIVDVVPAVQFSHYKS